MEEIDHPEGKIWKVGNKYFFVADRNWQHGADLRDKNYIQQVHVSPELKMLQRALSRNPDSNYFRFSVETMEFVPDQLHEWSRD